MKDKELDDLLKSVSAPARTDEYWKRFPQKVTAQLHWQPQAAARSDTNARRNLKPFLAWGFGFATICLILGVNLSRWRGHELSVNMPQLVQAKVYYHEIETLFPNQVKAIVFDREGAHMILADKAEVPNSTPFYVRICGPKGCQGIITFSGQEVRLDGENFEVLADAHGQVMLVGNDRVWSGSNPSDPIRIESRPLEANL
ncbi:MAG: hypothetical protein JWR19_917 [Pedosphaera sp.]|nr:hypothetical protein [Pedosphaera sp.]